MSTATKTWAGLPQAKSCLAVVVAVLTLLPGCGGVEEAKLEDYLDVLEFSAPMESLRELRLGSFVVSSATRAQEAAQSDTQQTWVQISCELYVVVAEEDEEKVVAAYERHRGVFDDTIVQIFRSSSLDELTDPRWSTIKSRLSDFTRAVLGGERILQVVINDYGWEPL